MNKGCSKNNRDFIIALDFDGVVSNPYKLKVKYINELGYQITEKESGYDCCVRNGNVKEEDYQFGYRKALLEKPSQIPLQAGFKNTYLRIRQLKSKIYIITARSNDMIKNLKEYLNHYNIIVDGIINTCNKSKLDSLVEIKPVLFIDDSPFIMNQILEKREDIEYRCFFNTCKLILLRIPSNVVEPVHDKGIYEAESWNDVYNQIIILYESYKQTGLLDNADEAK